MGPACALAHERLMIRRSAPHTLPGARPYRRPPMRPDSQLCTWAVPGRHPGTSDLGAIRRVGHVDRIEEELPRLPSPVGHARRVQHTPHARGGGDVAVRLGRRDRSGHRRPVPARLGAYLGRYLHRQLSPPTSLGLSCNGHVGTRAHGGACCKGKARHHTLVGLWRRGCALHPNTADGTAARTHLCGSSVSSSRCSPTSARRPAHPGAAPLGSRLLPEYHLLGAEAICLPSFPIHREFLAGLPGWLLDSGRDSLAQDGELGWMPIIKLFPRRPALRRRQRPLSSESHALPPGQWSGGDANG